MFWIVFESLSSWYEITDEGEYTCQVCTVFGLDKEEVKTLCGVGLKFTDQNKEAEGYEVKTSAFKASTKIKKLWSDATQWKVRHYACQYHHGPSSEK